MNIFNKILLNQFISLTELNDLSLEDVISIENQLDDYFQLNYKDTENTLLNIADNYPIASYIESELENSALNNSYLDFYRIALALDIKNFETFVDLGAGYCKAGLGIGLLNPSINVMCLEFVKERVNRAKEASSKLTLPNTQFIVQDLLEEKIELPIANYYFIYLPNGKLLESLLRRLKQLSKVSDFKLIIIESHGELVNRVLIESSWLIQEDIILQSSLSRHDNNIYIFQSRKQHTKLSKRESSLHALEKVIYSDKQSELIFNEQDHGHSEKYKWSASSLNAHLSFLNLKSVKLELTYPPKIMPISDIESINQDLNKISYLDIFKKRSKDENFKIYSKKENKEIDAGKLRKIIIEKDIILEFSKIGRIPNSKLEIL